MKHSIEIDTYSPSILSYYPQYSDKFCLSFKHISNEASESMFILNKKKGFIKKIKRQIFCFQIALNANQIFVVYRYNIPNCDYLF